NGMHRVQSPPPGGDSGEEYVDTLGPQPPRHFRRANASSEIVEQLLDCRRGIVQLPGGGGALIGGSDPRVLSCALSSLLRPRYLTRNSSTASRDSAAARSAWNCAKCPLASNIRET